MHRDRISRCGNVLVRMLMCSPFKSLDITHDM